MSNLDEHSAEQDALTAEWNRQADAYIAAAYGDCLINLDQEADLDFQVDDSGAMVTIRIWISREDAGI